jgi:hypothetical protein
MPKFNMYSSRVMLSVQGTPGRGTSSDINGFGVDAFVSSEFDIAFLPSDLAICTGL